MNQTSPHDAAPTITANELAQALGNAPAWSVTIEAYTAFILISQLQLAARHPENTGPAANLAKGFAVNLAQIFNSIDPRIVAIIDKGWDPNFDIPRGEYDPEKL